MRMCDRIRPLPHWVLTNNRPAFYDTESATAVQMVAKLYGYVDELVKDYNCFIDEINCHIEEYENSVNKDMQCFKNKVIKTLNDYMNTLNTKINCQNSKITDSIKSQNKYIKDSIDEQNLEIENAVKYMKDNLIQTVTNLFNEALQNGEITAELATTYDESTMSLTLSIVAEREGE